MKKNSEVKVLTEKEIKQKMAGHKSAYCKRMKAAASKKELAALIRGRESYLAGKEKEIRLQNRKAIQSRAGKLSWVTRKKNESARKSARSCSASTRKVSVRCIHH